MLMAMTPLLSLGVMMEYNTSDSGTVTIEFEIEIESFWKDKDMVSDH